MPRPIIETFKKSLLKSVSSGSVDKPTEKTLDIQTTEVRSPSPIPEDPVEEEVSKQPESTSAGTTDQEKKVDETEASKRESAQEQPKESGEASEVEEAKEKEKKEVKPEDEGKSEQSDRKGNNGDNGDKGEISETKEENEAGKRAESDTKESESEAASTTKLRGKSKATGQIMGGWI